jgi:hypothetical protein
MCGQPRRRRTAAPAPAQSHVSSACRAVLQTLVDSYGGDTHRLLTDVADVLRASIARADWIEDVLAKAGVPGRGHTGQPVSASPWVGA